MKKDEIEPEYLWDYIKYLRERNNYDYVEFARRIKCSYVHVTQIEREYNVVRRTASPALLKTIADVCSKNPEDRMLLEQKLLRKRARIVLQQDLAEHAFGDLSMDSFIVSDSMPKVFIERLKKDISNLEDKNVITKLSITKTALDAVLAGRYFLSHRKVSEIAKRFKQPENEYLILAGYIPESLRKLIDNEHFIELLEKNPVSLHKIIYNVHFRKLLENAKHLTEGDIERLGIALGNMLNLLTISDTKKRRARKPSHSN